MKIQAFRAILNNACVVYQDTLSQSSSHFQQDSHGPMNYYTAYHNQHSQSSGTLVVCHMASCWAIVIHHVWSGSSRTPQLPHSKTLFVEVVLHCFLMHPFDPYRPGCFINARCWVKFKIWFYQIYQFSLKSLFKSVGKHQIV